MLMFYAGGAGFDWRNNGSIAAQFRRRRAPLAQGAKCCPRIFELPAGAQLLQNAGVPPSRPTLDDARSHASGVHASGVAAGAIPAAVQSALALRGKRRHYRKGTLLIEEGDLGDAVFLILSGRVRVFATDEDGREFTHTILAAGDYFGEMSLDGGVRSASVITTEATECAVLGKADMRAHMAADPDFAFELLTTVIRRARAATRAARGLALGGVYSRLAAFLENSAQADADGSRVISEVLTQQEIANRIGSSREMVSRIMKDLEAGGYVELRARRIFLKRALPAKW